MGSDKESGSNFQLIAGTNQDLLKMVSKGSFREDLLARINLWSYRLPSLKERIEDFEPNLNFELSRYAKQAGHLVSFNKTARIKYLKFARSPEGAWTANFRDLNSSIVRMATLSNGGRISMQIVDEEIERLRNNLNLKSQATENNLTLIGIIEEFIDKKALLEIDYYEHIKIAGIIRVCRESASMAEAGRKLFNHSRTLKNSNNDSHRLKQILNRYGLTFDQIQ